MTNVFEISPPEIHFNDIQSGNVYILDVSIRNISLLPKRIKLGRPSNPAFSVARFSEQIIIAPGLTFTTTVSFNCTDVKNLEDSIILFSDDVSLKSSSAESIAQISVFTHAPIADIRFDSFLDFREIQVGVPHVRYIRIWNAGSRPGEFHFNVPQDSGLKFTPSQGQLLPLDDEGRLLLAYAESGDAEQAITQTLKSVGKQAEIGFRTNDYTHSIGDVGSSTRMTTSTHKPVSAMRIRVEYFTKKPTSLHQTIDCDCLSSDPSKSVTVQALAVQQFLDVCLAERPSHHIETLDFGTIFYHEQRNMKIVLTNHGPNACQFSLSPQSKNITPIITTPPAFPSDADSKTLQQSTNDPLQPKNRRPKASRKPPVKPTRARSQTPNSPSQRTEEPPLTPTENVSSSTSNPRIKSLISERHGKTFFKMSQMMGSLDSNKNTEITCTFAPPPLNNTFGFAHQERLEGENVSEQMLVEIPETGQKLSLTLTGRVITPNTTVDKMNIDFGDCFLNDHLDDVLQITNFNEDLAVSYSFAKIPFFSVSPSSGKLLPSKTIEVLVSYKPTQLGTHESTLKLSLSGGASVIPIHVRGNTITPVPASELVDELINPPMAQTSRGRSMRAVVAPSAKDLSSGQAMVLKRKAMAKTNLVQSGGVTVSNPSDFQRKRSAPAGTLRTREDFQYLQNPVSAQTRTRQVSNSPVNLQTLTQGAPRTADVSTRKQLWGDVHAQTVDRHKNAAREYVRSTSMGSNNAQANSVLEAVEQKKKNNQKYSDFVTNARQERSLSKKGVNAGLVRTVGRSTAENSLFPTNYDPFTDINLGLDSDQLDTDAPEPLVPRQAEPLFLLNSGQSEVVMKPKIRSQLSDTNTLVKHKYKPNATTAIEQKEVRAQLNPNEISLISIGTRHIDFGRVTVYSKSARSLNISNDITANIQATLVITNPELSLSSPASQIIPPGAMAGFDIIFTSDNAQNFTGQIIVQINGNNLFNVTIAADIIPISLELPVNEVFLSFSSSNISRCVSETFNITNPGNHPANFHWEMDQTALLGNSSTDARVVQLPPASVIMHGSYIKEGEGIQTDLLVPVPLETLLAEQTTIEDTDLSIMSTVNTGPSHFKPPAIQSKTAQKLSPTDIRTLKCDCFFITPQMGTVPPYGTVPVTITFDPTSAAVPQPNYLTYCYMHVDGGGDKNLRIIGEVSEGRAEFVEKQIDFGAFAVGSEITKHATLKNQSKSNVCFFVEKTDPSLSVVPLTGTIPIGGQILLAVTINSSSSRKIVEKITVSIRGGVQQSVSVVAEALEPNVEIGEPSIDFGEVIVGNSRRRRLTLTNTGSIAAILYADLSEYPDFRIVKRDVKMESRAQANSETSRTSQRNASLQNDFGVPDGVRHLSQFEITQARGAETEDNQVIPIAPSSIPVDIRRAIQRRMGRLTQAKKVAEQKHSMQFGTQDLGMRDAHADLGDTEFGSSTVEEEQKKNQFPFKTKPTKNDAWGKWNGVGAFDNFHRPLQGLVDLLGTHSETVLMDAFSQPQLQSEEGQAPPKNIRGMFATNPNASVSRDDAQREPRIVEDRSDRDSSQRNVSKQRAPSRTGVNATPMSKQTLTIDTENDENEGLTSYLLKIQPNSTLMCELEYTADILAHDFVLYLFLSATQSASTTHALSRQITAKGVPARLSVSPRQIDFGARTISTLAKPLHKLSVTLVNTEHSPLKWRIDASNIPEIQEDIFQVTPSEGTLANGQEDEFIVSFFPKEEAEYKLSIPLFLNDEKSEYCDITVTALGIKQQLVFEPKELFLQPVPLGFTSRSRLLIRNVGYDLTDVQAQLPGDPALTPLKVVFLEGQQLTLNKQTIVVDVSMMSRKPVTFSNHIVFFDSFANPFKVLVHAVADNDVLSTTGFLFANHRILRSMQDTFDGTPYIKEDALAVEREQKALVKKASQAQDSSDITAIAPSPEPQTNVEGSSRPPFLAPAYAGSFSLPYYPSSLNKVLLRFLNTSFLASRISAWPESMIEQFGQPLWEVLEDILGEKIQGRLLAEIMQTMTMTGNTTHAAPPVSSVIRTPMSPSKQPVTPTARNRDTQRISLPQTMSSQRGLGRTQAKNQLPPPIEDDSVKDRPIVHTERLQAILSHYTAILAFIRSYGGGVSELRPEYFLKWADYARFVADVYVSSRFHYPVPDVNEILFAVQKSQETKETFAVVSNIAWTTLLLQIIKLFVLSKVTLKRFKALPGIFKEEKQKEAPTDAAVPATPSKKRSASAGRTTATATRTPTIAKTAAAVTRTPTKQVPKSPARQPTQATGLNPDQLISQKALSLVSSSTTYSVAEVLLLKWLSYHFYRSGARKPYCVSNFASDLSDGVVLLNVINVHCPFLHLKKHDPCRTEAERTKNAATILGAMKQLGIETIVQESDIVHPDPRVMILVVYSLFQILPYFIPQTKIEIPAASGVTKTKVIELQNPSQRTLQYTVKLEGSAEFVLQTPHVTLESPNPGSVTVTVSPRFSNPIKATLLFIPKNEGGGQVHPIAMQLVTKVLNPTPSATYSVTTPLYGCAYCEVKVRNPFPNECVLTTKVSVIETQPEEPPPAPTTAAKTSTPGGTPKLLGTPKTQSGPVQSRTGSRATLQEHSPAQKQQVQHDTIKLAEKADFCPFRLNTQQLTLTSGATGTIQVQFQPISVGVHRCRVMFRDEDQGEFTVEIEGISTIPAPSESFIIIGQADTASQQEIIFPAKNRRLEAVKAENSQLEKALFPLLPTPGNSLTYQVESTSPFFSIPKELQIVLEQPQGLKKALSTADGQKTDTSGGRVRLPFSFRPKQAGEYMCRVVLKSALDLRIFDIKGIAQSPGMEATIDLQTIARKPVSQEIPITNPTLTEWVMKCTLTPTSGSAGAGNQAVFTGPSELKINPRSTAMYKLVFAPKKAVNATCDLAIVNTVQSSSSTPSTAADKFSFHIRGVADDPPADGHIEVDTVARVEQKRKIVVPMANPGHINKYRVVCDVPSCSGEGTFSVYPPTETSNPPLPSTPSKNPVAAFNRVSPTKLKSDSKISTSQPTPALSSYPSAQAHSNEYELTILSTHAGVEEGTLMFITDEEEVIWYTIKITSTAPKVEEKVNLRTQVRKPIALDLRLFNPSETESIVFTVKMRGMGLTGPPSFHLDPLDEDVYTLIYAPVFPTPIPEGVENEEDKFGELGFIAFSNDIAGEFLYELHLTCDDIEPVTIPPFECELGMSSMVTLSVTNPMPIPLQLEGQSSNPLVFSIAPLSAQHQRTLVNFDRKEIESVHQTVDSHMTIARVDALNLLGLQNKIVVQPSQTVNFICKFSPSQIDVEEAAMIKITSRDGGEWKWNVTGKGLAPTLLPPVDVVAQVQESSSKIVSFTNPFAYPLLATLTLKVESTQADLLQPNSNPSGLNSSPHSSRFTPATSPTSNTPNRPDADQFSQTRLSKQAGFFQILLKQIRNVRVEARSALQVPILFSPQYLLTTVCQLTVTAIADPASTVAQESPFTDENPLVWTQPIIGTAEMFFPQLPINSLPGATDQTKDTGSSPQAQTASTVREGKTKSGYTSLSIVGQAGEETEKTFVLPLSGLVITRKALFSFVQRCAVNQTFPIPNYFMEYFNEIESSKKRENMDSEGNPAKKEAESGDMSEEDWKAFYEILSSILTISIDSEDEHLIDELTISSPIAPPPNIPALTTTPILPISLTFKPLIFCHRTRVNLIINRSPTVGGGRWRYTIWTTANNAPDSIAGDITITSLVNQRAEATIEIVSSAHKSQPFHCLFRSGASPEFSLTPRDGFFDANGRALVTLIFAPVRYGSTRSCFVTVSTASKQWMYSVKGELPPYVPPSGQSKVGSYRN
ncbi:putative Cilia- and flagella-associated protein 47 [Blattamonas nauphoetae]|uniref:Cilia- and flagella-associated protein 47 n=1 Tax=Blattamonas nauphoetae TaxID=2049346 RepID=A0ABQ9XEA5_9EUKA|nr:putative Cilia- and flagella-associated protein 47 [Blattamonas nauphoetae]